MGVNDSAFTPGDAVMTTLTLITLGATAAGLYIQYRSYADTKRKGKSTTFYRTGADLLE